MDSLVIAVIELVFSCRCRCRFSVARCQSSARHQLSPRAYSDDIQHSTTSLSNIGVMHASPFLTTGRRRDILTFKISLVHICPQVHQLVNLV